MDEVEPLDVECPECGARVGRQCRDGAIHWARLELAELGPMESGDEELGDLLDLRF